MEKEPTFTTYQGSNEFADGWFNKGEGILYQKFVSKIKNGKIVEVGFFEGLSSSHIKDLLKTNNNKCYSVNIHDRKRLVENTKSWGIEFLHMTSVEASGKFENNSLDLVFIDANHAYKFVKEDIICWLPKVKIGGVLMGHDIDRYFKGVGIAVRELLFPVEIVGRIWIYTKTGKLFL